LTTAPIHSKLGPDFQRFLHSIVPAADPALETESHTQYTIKPFMFACPLFCEFHELNKTAKLWGVNIDIPTLVGIVCCVGIVWIEFAEIKAPK